jgi:hypothetical protein
MTTIRNYRELSGLSTFAERFQYLSLSGEVGVRTFGGERYLNQRFYNSSEWKRARNEVIVRDNGCDLGIEGREIYSTMYIHHITPITPNDFKFGRPSLIDPDNLITVTHRTHNAIHYGDESQLEAIFTERTPGDTKDW